MSQSNNWGTYHAPQVNYKVRGINALASPPKQSINEANGQKMANLPQSVALQQVMAKHHSAVTNDELSQIESIILQLVTQSNQDRLTYYKLLNEFENYYLCTAVYDVMQEEILRDNGTGVVIKVTSEKYQDLCDQAMKVFNIPSLVESALPQLLHYGDYSYRVNKSYKDENDYIGEITSISDDFVPGEVMAIYNNGVPVKYYRLPLVRTIRQKGSVSQVNGSILDEAKELSLADVIHFSLKSEKIKLELEERYAEKFATPVLNVGIGLLWGVIDRLLLLKFREISTVATDLSRLTRPTLVGAMVPQSDSSDKIMEHCKKLETLLNSTSVDISGYTGNFITAITSAMSNNYKVIPSFASGRGDARKLSVENEIDTTNDEQKLQDERQMILQLAGIPPEIALSSTGSTQSPQRIYVRLSKKVKSVQRSIARTIVQFLVHYIATQTGDLEVSENDIEVVMNSASNIEDIDDTEALGYVLDNVKSLIDAADQIKRAKLLGSLPSEIDPHTGDPMESEGISPINGERFMDYLRTEFKNSGSNAARIWLTDEEIAAARDKGQGKNAAPTTEVEPSPQSTGVAPEEVVEHPSEV